jgi:hypothetical protein
MRTSNKRPGNYTATVGKIVMAVVCALLIGGSFIAPAFGEDHSNGKSKGNQYGHYKKNQRVYHPPSRHYYPAPVYAPPPVVYYPAPYQSPGISIVFPIHIE